MERKHTIPVSREDLVFSVDMALRKAERFWPKKRGPGDHDRLRPFAELIVIISNCAACAASGGLADPATARPIPGSRRERTAAGTADRGAGRL